MTSRSDSFENTSVLTDFIGEFPRNDDRYQMQKYRHGWLLGFGPGRNTLGHIDHKTGITEQWEAPPDMQCRDNVDRGQPVPGDAGRQRTGGHVETAVTP